MAQNSLLQSGEIKIPAWGCVPPVLYPYYFLFKCDHRLIVDVCIYIYIYIYIYVRC